MTEKLGCFIYVLAIASFFIPFFVMLILSMLEGLKH